MRSLTLTVFILLITCAARAELRVPAFTAYLEPEANGATVSEKTGVTGWKGGATKVVWFGKDEIPGQLSCAIEMPEPDQARNTG